MPNGTYGGVRGRKTKVGRKLLRFPPTRCFQVGRILRAYSEGCFKFTDNDTVSKSVSRLSSKKGPAMFGQS